MIDSTASILLIYKPPSYSVITSTSFLNSFKSSSFSIYIYGGNIIISNCFFTDLKEKEIFITLGQLNDENTKFNSKKGITINYNNLIIGFKSLIEKKNNFKFINLFYSLIFTIPFSIILTIFHQKIIQIYYKKNKINKIIE